MDRRKTLVSAASGNVKLSSLSGRFPKNERGSGGTSIRSFNPLSSRSSASLSSNSKRSLISDSFKISKAKALIVEDGIDMTPQTLLSSDQYTARKTHMLFRADTKTDSPFQTTLFPTGASINQPFSQSVFSGNIVDMGGSSGFATSTSGDLLHHPSVDDGISRDESTFLTKLFTEEDLETEVRIILSETNTFWMVNIPGTCVSIESEEAQDVLKSNERYNERLLVHTGNDSYSERGMQTISCSSKTKQIQTEATGKKDVGIVVSTWQMFDVYDTLRQTDDLPKGEEEEEGLEYLSSQGAISWKKRTRKGTTSALLSRDTVDIVNITSIGPESSTLSWLGENSTSVSLLESTDSQHSTPTITQGLLELSKQPILKSEVILDKFRILERAITNNLLQPKQAMYRQMEPLIDPEHITRLSSELISINAPHMDKLWTYSCSLTKNYCVTSMAWNHSNQDVVAVGYGTFKVKNDNIGLVCCWSIKNPQFPERVFHAPSGITSLDFSKMYPNLLAAGLLNGGVLIYNARSSKHDCILDSSHMDFLHIHTAPVWQITWVMKEHSLGENISERLVSISVDGHVLNWSISKGFESSQLMNLKRTSGKKQVVKKSKAKTNQIRGGGKLSKQSSKTMTKMGLSYISQYAPGMGLDFWPKDPNIYLVCTEEGYIHKCSSSYNEQFLETYIGHTVSFNDAVDNPGINYGCSNVPARLILGPVYRVTWSPFVSDYFLSCSEDWSVKLWNQNSTSPLQSFSAAQMCVNDVCWSPFSSTMFGCVSDGRIEIWNLYHNCLDPMIVHKPLRNASQTTISFAANSQCLIYLEKLVVLPFVSYVKREKYSHVALPPPQYSWKQNQVVLVGDSEGKVTVYLLKNLPEMPQDQEEALSTAVNSMSSNNESKK